MNRKLSGVVGSVCHELGIPHIIVQWMPEELVTSVEHHLHTRSFFPEPNLFARALAQIIVDYEWKGFTLIYENSDSKTTQSQNRKKKPH